MTRRVDEVEERWRAQFSSRIFELRHDCCEAPALAAHEERTNMIDVVMPQMGESIVEGTLTNG